MMTHRTMTTEDLQRIIDQVPMLNDHGISVYNAKRCTPEERAKELEAGRAHLMRSLPKCNKVCAWLEGIKPTKRPNGRIGTSYSLKHIAEREIGYITNGVFIAAAVFCGYPYRIISGSPNVILGMSKKSIDQRTLRVESLS